jgi:hypothetical protein
MFIWLSKLTVSEFLKRITIRIWRRSYEITLQGIRIFLFLTFGAVVIATLTECDDFSKYWQVIPDPGPRCRKGFAQLITMGTCDIITDIVLIAFPVPVVLRSGQSWQRKLQMISLFGLSIILIGITATRMPEVVMTGGRQQYRTAWASVEILASAFVSNAVTLGSFLRDKGTKKNKYRTYSVSDSMDRASARRPTLATLHPIDEDEDEDLFRSLGYGIPVHLQHRRSVTIRPAPRALSAAEEQGARAKAARNRAIPPKTVERLSESDESDHDEPGVEMEVLSPTASKLQDINLSDVGHLLDGGPNHSDSNSHAPTVDSPDPSITAQDFAHAQQPAQAAPGSRAFLADVGGILNHDIVNELRNGRLSPRRHHEAFWSHHNRDRSPRSAPIGVLAPTLERHETNVSLQDAGGLLVGSSRRPYVMARNAAMEDIELEDVGALLSNGAQRDQAAVALQRRLARDDRTRPGTSTPSPRRNGGPNDMVLSDPGGLAKM